MSRRSTWTSATDYARGPQHVPVPPFLVTLGCDADRHADYWSRDLLREAIVLRPDSAPTWDPHADLSQ